MDVGQQISHYLLKKKIGEGGFGDVFLAVDRHTNQELALKCSRPSEYVLPDMHQRFLREVACALRLIHPNIVRTYEHGSLPNGTLFIVMEYIRGIDLDVVIKQEAPFVFRRAASIIVQVLDALNLAHSQGIVHRDLKPANIMLTKAPNNVDFVKLLDFGIAKAFDGSQPDLTRQNLNKDVGFGTPQYMAPEQIFAGNIGPFTDIYAAGLMFFELLTGTQPMLRPNLSDMIYQQLKVVPIPPAPFNEGPLKEIFLRALAKDPSMRYASATEMKQDIFQIFERTPDYLALYESANQDTHPGSMVPLSDVNTSLIAADPLSSQDNDPTVDTKSLNQSFTALDGPSDVIATQALLISHDLEDGATVDLTPIKVPAHDIFPVNEPTNPIQAQASPPAKVPPPLIAKPKPPQTQPPAAVGVGTQPAALDNSSEATSIYPVQTLPNISEINTSLVVPDDNLRALYHQQLASQTASAEFHRQRTKVLSRKNLYRRSTHLNPTKLSGRLRVAIASSRPWRRLYASGFAQKIRSWRLRQRFTSLFLEIYRYHFPALIAIVCLLTLIFVVSILILLT